MKKTNYAGRYIPNILLTLHLLVQSRFGTLRLAKSLTFTAQTTRPLQRNGAWRALVSLHLTRIQDPTLRWCDCDTAAYDHSDPEEIAQT